jgi:PAS domain S-box-containing protein
MSSHYVAVASEAGLAADLAAATGDSLDVAPVSGALPPRGGLDRDVDLLVLDRRRPDEPWRAVVARVADARPALPVVVVGEPSDTTPALDAGAVACLPRSLCESAPEVVADRLSTLVGAGAGGPVPEAVLDATDSAVAVADPETGTLVRVDRRMADLLGTTPEALAGRDVEAVSPDAGTAGSLPVAAAASPEGPSEAETTVSVETVDGDHRVLDATVRRVDRGGGARVVVSGRDVTRAVERLPESGRIVELFDGPASVHDPETGALVDANGRLTDLLGVDRERLCETGLAPYTPDADLAVDAAATGSSWTPRREEYRLTTADGEERWLSTNLMTGTDYDRWLVFAVSADVTDRKRRERRLEAARRRFRLVAENVDEILYVANGDFSEVEFISERYEEVWGRPVEEVYDDPTAFVEGVDPRDREAFRERLESMRADLRAGDPDERYEFEFRVRRPDGEVRWIRATGHPVTDGDVGPRYVGTAKDVTEREAAKRRLRAILDRIDEAIFLAPASELTSTDPAPEFVSSGYETIWGRSLAAIHETYEDGFFGTLHPEDRDRYRALLGRIADETERGVADERYSHEYRIERADGEVRWVNSDFYPTDWGDGTPRVVIVSRDVTDRVARERQIESFHDATAELTTVESVTGAGRVAVAAAADVFDLPATAVYRYDDETAALDPVAAGPAAPDPTDLPTLAAADEAAWDVFVGGTVRRVGLDDGSLAVGPGDRAVLLPLGGTGLLVVWQADGPVDTEGASILGATLEAAMNRIRGERRLASRREELAAQTERARRLEAITELTRRVEAAITGQSSRYGVEEAVCDELTDVEPFDAAWVAAAEVGTDRLRPRAVAGVDRDHVERALAPGDAERPDPHPAVEAWRTGDPRVVDDLVGAGRCRNWRRILLKRGAGAVCAVPLSYEGVTYGVLAVVADDPAAFDGRMVDTLAQLGTSIGYAITAAERQRALESDDTVELEFRGSGLDVPFARLASALDCRVRHDRTVRRQDGSISVYHTLRDPPDDAVDRARALLPGDVDAVARRADEVVVERRGSSWFGSVVSEYGGVLRRTRATGDDATVVVEFPSEADTPSIVERLCEAFPALSLHAQRQHHETRSAPAAVRERLERRLSDRQQEALETAYAMGYFEWPRESTGETVAEALGITQPTVNKHLRIGERKVFELLFDDLSGASYG